MKVDPKHIRIGRIGEQIAADYLCGKRFEIICRNYRQKSGEIDIVAKINSMIHFVEVKTVSCENLKNSDRISGYRPEDNVHRWKRERLKRAISIFLQEKYSDLEPDWQFDIITVEIDDMNKIARVNFIKDIII